ncbi:heavy metal transporter [Reichenbachiella sp. MALMAid0571]|uniref:heavy metal transporter n=1 Tax=Reichenbachiella sp. MALMAid0571 TaxID=3143939 RepID=UPI0032E03532
MGKIIKPSYPIEISIGLLILIFALSFFLSGQIFAIPRADLQGDYSVYFGMFLASLAVLIMVLILWEELLFPVAVDLQKEEVIFRNHRTKLKIQAFIYLSIPAIFGFIYLNYQIHEIRFYIWAAICVLVPVVGKLVSGINNYNDFLKLTSDVIEYKNNKKEGAFEIKNIQQITPIKDERDVLYKVQLSLANDSQVTIDLDEMELEAFYDSIEKYITDNYQSLIKGV